MCVQNQSPCGRAPRSNKNVRFMKQTIYCGLKITREGIEVDPERVNGLLNLPSPENIGDVWQFNAAAGWIRDEIPLFSEASTKLTDLITAVSE